MHPLRFSDAAALGRNRQGRSYNYGGPSRSKDSHAVAAAIVSEPSPDALAHRTVDNTDYRILAWRSPPYGDRRCSPHLSHRSSQMYEDNHYTVSPSPQFAIP